MVFLHTAQFCSVLYANHIGKCMAKKPLHASNEPLNSLGGEGTGSLSNGPYADSFPLPCHFFFIKEASSECARCREGKVQRLSTALPG